VTALDLIAPSEHVLGIVCGLPESLRSNRLLLMLKAYIDDSHMRQPPFYVLGGWVASVKTWAAFSDAWRDILRMSPRIEYFKYDEAMGLSGEFHGISEAARDEKLRLLINLIEEHGLVGVASVIPHCIFYPMFGTYPHKWVRIHITFHFSGLPLAS
jgi:hypothetical protein